jgi:hypothetical protein
MNKEKRKKKGRRESGAKKKKKKKKKRKSRLLIDSSNICSSNVPAKDLFTIGQSTGAIHVDEGIHSVMNLEQQKAFSGEEELFMFARCCSRLEEMQTDAYLRSPHSPPK